MPKPRKVERNTRGLRGRQVDVTPLRSRFLIVCEGTRTEPAYFSSFPVASAVVEVCGEGCNTISLVKRALELRAERDFTEETDQVWCVFDKDDNSAEQFNTAIVQAREAGLGVAYSNEAFELWYLLHFAYHDTALHRDRYIEILTDKLGRKYKKNDKEMYKLLLPKQPLAIRYGKRLYEKLSSSPANDNPSTTVFMLVEALNEYLR